MRAAPAGYAAALAHGYQMRTSVSAWIGGRMVAADIPITSGELTVDGADLAPEELRISVPVRDIARGTRWVPRAARSPLGTDAGQRLRVTTGIVRSGTRLPIDLGWYRIDDWDEDGTTIEVVASGLLTAVDYILGRPYQPAGQALSAVARTLVDAQLPVALDPLLTDRACPARIAWAADASRLDALAELLAAWPADARVTDQGVLLLRPPAAGTTPAVTLTDGADGTVIELPTSGTRGGIHNGYLVTGQAADAARTPVDAFVTHDDTASPYHWDGTWGRSTGKFSSPIMSTAAQCAAAARTLIAKSLRAAEPWTVTHAPDARLDLGDVITATKGDVTRTGRVIGYTIPLTVADIGKGQKTKVGAL